MRLLPLLIALLAAAPAWGFYVLTYDLRPHAGERYSAVVILPDHFAQYFGPQDGLQDLMAQGYFPNDHPGLTAYIGLVGEFYLQSILNEPRAYGGADIARKIVESYRTHEPVVDPLSAYIIITERNQITRPIAHVRVTPRGQDGLLSAERHFVGRGLDSPLPKPDLTWKMVSYPQWNGEPNRSDFFKIGGEVPRVTFYAPEGDVVELKNYRMDPKSFRKFIVYLRNIGQRHRAYYYGSRNLWKSEETSEIASNRGIFVNRLDIEAWGPFFRRLYEKNLGFRVVKTINNEHTFGQDLHFLTGSIPTFESNQDHQWDTGPDATQWLVHRPDLVTPIRKGECTLPLLIRNLRSTGLSPEKEEKHAS